MAGKELQTGLPEYRNAGLFTDFGIFRPKLEAFAASMNVSEPSNMLELPPLAAGHPGIVEWRALTVVYLDRMHKEVCSLLGQQLSLAQVSPFVKEHFQMLSWLAAGARSWYMEGRK